MRIEVEVWRQDGPRERGRFETHVVEDATPEMSLLELLDRLNDTLAEAGQEPIQFESDCREGACGACGVTVNDVPHGPVPKTPSCRQHLRAFGAVSRLRIEPLRSAAYPVVRDLVVDQLDAEFGPCSTYGECVEVCPAGIPLAAVAAVHRERLRGVFRGRAD